MFYSTPKAMYESAAGDPNSANAWAEAYQTGVLGQTQNSDGVYYYGTRGALAVATIADAAALAIELGPLLPELWANEVGSVGWTRFGPNYIDGLYSMITAAEDAAGECMVAGNLADANLLYAQADELWGLYEELSLGLGGGL